jgi:para-nitrobenzyl esterase
VFTYRWDWDEEPTILWADLGFMLGATHAFEIPFVFGHFDLGPAGNRSFTRANQPGRETLSAAMRAYWAAFARNGTPADGEGTLPLWTPWDPAGDRDMILDTEQDGGLRMSDEAKTIDDLAAEILNDPTFVDERERCTALAFVADDNHAYWGEADFEGAGDGHCARFEMNDLIESHNAQ